MIPAPRLTPEQEAERRAEYERAFAFDDDADDERRAARGLIAWVTGSAATTVVVSLLVIVAACQSPSTLAPETSIHPMPRPEDRP